MNVVESLLLLVFNVLVFPGVVVQFLLQRMTLSMRQLTPSMLACIAFLFTPVSIIGGDVSNIIIGSMILLILGITINGQDLDLWIGFSLFFNILIVSAIILLEASPLLIYPVLLLIVLINTPFSSGSRGEERYLSIVFTWYFTSYILDRIGFNAIIVPISLIFAVVIGFLAPVLYRFLYSELDHRKAFDKYVSINGALVFLYIAFSSLVVYLL